MSFFTNFLKDPKKVGSVIPSSKFLSKAMAQYTKGPIIVEIGAGTGAFTRDLSQKTTPENFYAIEIDDEMYQTLVQNFPDLQILKGDASSLKDILPKEVIRNVDTIVSGIPLLNLSQEARKDIIDSCFSILKKEGQILQFTYGPACPIPAKKWKIHSERLTYILNNVPPAFIWRFTKMTKN